MAIAGASDHLSRRTTYLEDQGRREALQREQQGPRRGGASVAGGHGAMVGKRRGRGHGEARRSMGDAEVMEKR